MRRTEARSLASCHIGRKGAADEQMSFVFSKKKAVVAEKRQKKEQKEEAEKHIRMQKELVSPDSASPS